MRARPEERARDRMVAAQIVGRGVRDPRVLEAMRAVPRELFVPESLADSAYDDRPLPIGFGQTISQPYIVARMCELLALRGHERVLEVGAGSGYQTAVLARLADAVFAVEIIRPLARQAGRTVAGLGIDNVVIECTDGSAGWPEHAPYDAIVVAAGAPRIPVLLVDQLGDGGRLVLPVGPRDSQRLAVVSRRGGDYDTCYHSPVRFVDLAGRYGWGGSGPATA